MVGAVANEISMPVTLLMRLRMDPHLLANLLADCCGTTPKQQRITDYVANNPRHGCIPQPAFIDFDLAKHGEWIKLESFEDLQDEYDRQWGLLNCEGLVLVE
jgi:hypothetical protein